jgi:hypothetical protein
LSDKGWSRDDMLALARSSFGFLAEIAEQPVVLQNDFWQPVLAYTVGPVTVEVELDWREKSVFILICRTVDGRRPPGYYRHDGRLMREQLAEALDGGDEQDRATAARVRSVTRQSGPDAMATKIRELSGILEGMAGRLNGYQNLFMD